MPDRAAWSTRGGSSCRRRCATCATLRTLALLDLESHPPGGAVDRVTIVIDPTPGRVLQHTLYARAHPTPEQLSTLLARLGALMGQDRLGAPAAVDSYRPGAFAMAPFKTEHQHDREENNRGARRDRGENAVAFTQALRRCRQPVPARVAIDNGRPARVTTDRRGFVGGTVVRCAGPWRTSGEWWADGKSEVRSLKSEVSSNFRLQTSDFRMEPRRMGRRVERLVPSTGFSRTVIPTRGSSMRLWIERSERR